MKPSRLVAILTAISILGCGQTTNTRLNSRQNEERLNLNAPSVSLIIKANEAKSKSYRYFGELEINDINGDLDYFETSIDGELWTREYSQNKGESGWEKSDKTIFLYLFPDSIKNPLFNLFGSIHVSDTYHTYQRKGYNSLGDIPSGKHTMRVVAYDKAGNIGEAQIQYNLK